MFFLPTKPTRVRRAYHGEPGSWGACLAEHGEQQLVLERHHQRATIGMRNGRERCVVADTANSAFLIPGDFVSLVDVEVERDEGQILKCLRGADLPAWILKPR
jgi:hypothetical protein